MPTCYAKSIKSMASSYILKTNFDIILPSTPRSSKWTLSPKFPHLSSLLSIQHDTPIQFLFILWSQNYLENAAHTDSQWVISFSPRFTSPLLGKPSSSTPHSQAAFSHVSSSNINQVSHPYKITSNIVVLYISILYFLTENWKTKYSAPNGRRHSLSSIYM